MKHFRLHRSESQCGQYQYLQAEIYSNDDYHSSDDCVVLKWQGDREAVYWYGGKAELSASRKSQLDASLPILRAILDNDCLYRDPAGVIAILTRKGYVRSVYDQREGKFVATDKIAPDNVRSYRDGKHHDSCTVGCMASSEAEAKVLLAGEFVRYPEKMQEWVLAGMPVKIAYRGAEVPTVQSLEELLSLPTKVTKTRETAEVA